MEHNKIKAYIRVDGNPTIGLGHLIRCIALGHALKDSFQIIFVCEDIPKEIASDIINYGFELIKIRSESFFLNLLTFNDLVILDGYSFDLNYQLHIKSSSYKLICIDDLHNRQFAADLIINVAPGVTPDQYKAMSYTKFALGPDYALIRPTFLSAHRIREVSDIETVLICFGGADLRNLTMSTLNAISKMLQFKKIFVITGVQYNAMHTLNQFTSDTRIKFFHALNEVEMQKLMCQSDLAIVPASGILFEALVSGCKVVSGFCVDNQMDIYNGFLAAGAIVGAHCFAEDDLRMAIAKVPDHIFNKVVDGKSPSRLLKEIENVCSNISR